MKYTVGYDIGISSIGWAVVNQETNRLVDFGVRRFEQSIQANVARGVRSARTNLRRKNWRKLQLKDCFVNLSLEDKDKIFDEEYSDFNSTKFNRPDFATVYHLRKYALSNQVSTRELFLCLNSILTNRGHFHLDYINFERNTITLEIWTEKFYEWIEQKVEILNKDEFTEKYLKPYFNGKVEKFSKFKKNEIFTNTDEEQLLLTELYKLIRGYKVKLEMLELEKKTNILELKVVEGVPEFIEEAIILFDMKNVAKILQDNDYLCEKLSKQHDEYIQKRREHQNLTNLLNKKDYKYNIDLRKELDKYFKENKDLETKEYIKKKRTLSEVEQFYEENNLYELLEEKNSLDIYFKNLDDVNNKDKKNKKNIYSLSPIKNITNVYPNGLYVKEAKAILSKQKEFNPQITDDFINIVIEIITARIPYWVGKLDEKGKNAWIKRNAGKFQYSYNLSRDLVDETVTQDVWKKELISRCTYLNEEYALPKKSFIIELFGILNEINVLTAEKNGDKYYLKKKDKEQIINTLFLKESHIDFSTIQELLNLDYFGFDKTSKSSRKSFNKTFSLYLSISNIVDSLKIEDISKELDNYKKDIYNSKIYKIEKIIEVLTIFEDNENKRKALEDIIPEEHIESILKINSKDFSRLSAKFIVQTPIDINGNSLVDKLLEDNNSEYTNEQMTLIKNAVDINGKNINFNSNKYEKILAENNSLGYHLLMHENKLLFPVSRTVLRSINECMKVHNDLIKYFGQPDRIVIETAKDLGDPKLGETASHYKESKQLYDNLIKQNKELKKIFPKEYEKLRDIMNQNKKKIELYLRQQGVDLITGIPIDLNNIHDYHIDHVLPRGFGDNSMDNSILILGAVNSSKNDRLPLQYINSDRPEMREGYIKRVRKLKELKLISENKLERLLLEDSSSLTGFIERNLVDTRYIIKEITSIFEAYSSYNNLNTKVASLQATYNSLFRGALKLPKSRDLGDQHHAHDAAIIIIADKCFQTYYPNYDSGNKFSAERYKKFIQETTQKIKSPEFIKQGIIIEDEHKTKYNELLNFYRVCYYTTFGQSYSSEDSLVSDIKNTKPLISWKRNENYKGKFFNATIEKQIERKDTDVLSILEIDNSKRKYNSVECFCVDFYKVTTSKGIKKHYAIHVPKVIIDSNGNINKQQYIKLIKEHYNAKELLDENENLNTHFFRLRFRRNEIIYDTLRKTPMLFNIGSIALKKLELKPINIHSFSTTNEMFLDIYNKLKGDKKDFKSLYKSDFEIVAYTFNQMLRDGHKTKIENEDDLLNLISLVKIDINNNVKDIPNKHKDNKNSVDNFIKLNNMLLDENDNSGRNIKQIVEYIEVFSIASANIYSPPPIIDQIRPTADTISNIQDSQYVKVITSPLGVRYTTQENKLIIDGLRTLDNKTNFKIVKKETFTWEL